MSKTLKVTAIAHSKLILFHHQLMCNLCKVLNNLYPRSDLIRTCDFQAVFINGNVFKIKSAIGLKSNQF